MEKVVKKFTFTALIFTNLIFANLHYLQIVCTEYNANYSGNMAIKFRESFTFFSKV